jgi:predicted ATPase/DNA-binding winged helix-turn-helix (wHTH) protein
VTLGQRALEILLALVTRHGQLVTKDDLMAEVWPGIVVEENNIQVHVSALRKVLATAGESERFLVTVPGRGYRFVAEVQRAGAEAAPTGAPSTAAPPPAATDNLPQLLTTLIGRQAELAEIEAQLASHRLLTLVGSGGVGKTRLAIEAGRKLVSHYPDGVWLAELAPLKDPQLVASIIADALGVSLTAPTAAVETLVAGVKSKQCLLIIDNCEHVITEAARVAEALIRNCPRVSILASSRERLAIPGESVIRVPSLPAPPPQSAATAAGAREYAAVELFVERAKALGLDFTLTDANAATVSAVCQRLDGIPLAIELAVPRLKVLKVEQLARGLDDRFQILTGGSRTALPRQQTLHALIDWSYGFLTEPEKTLLARLAVFLGSTTLASIAAVDADKTQPQQQVGDLLLSLVEKSLAHADPAGDETRYHLLESTRYYALEKLGKAAALHKRHAEHFAARLAEATAAWEKTPTRPWIARYGADIDNLRAALEWAFGADGDVAVGLDLVGRSHVLWAELGLMLEHRRWVIEALGKVNKSTPPAVVARLLSWQAGDVRELDDPADYEEATRAATLYRKLGDEFQEGRALLRAGAARLSPDDPGQGEKLLRNALKLVRPAGSTKTLARCLSTLATARLFADALDDAHKLHDEAVTIYRDLGEVS